MKITITKGSGAKIQDIKVCRSITGLGLKDAKFAIDDVDMGKPYTFEIPAAKFAGVSNELRSSGMEWEADETMPMQAFCDYLLRFPGDMTVGQLHRTLLAVMG